MLNDRYRYLMILLMILLVTVPMAYAKNPRTNQTENETVVDDFGEEEDPELLNVTVEELVVPEEISIESVEEVVEEVVEEPAELIAELSFIGISPADVKVGDILLSVEIENTGEVAIDDVAPSIVGTGFTSHDVAPIDTLEPGESGEVLIAGRFSEPGDILLTIKLDGKRYYETVVVEEKTRADVIAEKAEEAEKLKALNVEIEALIELYDVLGEEFYAKSGTHDLKGIQLDDLRRYILNAETSLASQEADKTNLSVMMAKREYDAQKTRLDKANKLSFAARIKINVQVIGAILGTIIASITLFGMFGKPMIDKMRKKLKKK